MILAMPGEPPKKVFVYGRVKEDTTVIEGGSYYIVGRLELVEGADGPRATISGPMVYTTPDFDPADFFGPIAMNVMLGREQPPDIQLPVTPRDLEHARAILDTTVKALLRGDREVLDRLSLADDVLHARPANEAERLAEYLEQFKRGVKHYRVVSAGVIKMPPMEWLAGTIRHLATKLDPAFLKLTPAELAREYAGISSKRGPGEVGATRTAAALAVHVGAFNASRSDDFEKDVSRMMSRLRKATTEVRKKAPKALRDP